MSNGRLLVFQHLDVEHPGVFRQFLAEDGIGWRTVELDRGDAIPPLEDYDGLWVMGGPMDVWEEDLYPWLVAEKAAIRHAVTELKIPFMGVCLGHQLLADALGGRVGAGTPEVGIMDVELTAAGEADPFLNAVPRSFACLQWHCAEVIEVPPGAAVLASSPACKIQALAVGGNAFSAQFHVEITDATIDQWNKISAYRDALKEALGERGIAAFKEQTTACMPGFNAQARRLYDNWMSVARGRA